MCSPLKARTCSPLKARTCSPLKVRTCSPLKVRACSPQKVRACSPLKMRTCCPLKEREKERRDSTLLFSIEFPLADKQSFKTKFRKLFGKKKQWVMVRERL